MALPAGESVGAPLKVTSVLSRVLLRCQLRFSYAGLGRRPLSPVGARSTLGWFVARYGDRLV